VDVRQVSQRAKAGATEVVYPPRAGGERDTNSACLANSSAAMLGDSHCGHHHEREGVCGISDAPIWIIEAVFSEESGTRKRVFFIAASQNGKGAHLGGGRDGPSLRLMFERWGGDQLRSLLQLMECGAIRDDCWNNGAGPGLGASRRL